MSIVVLDHAQIQPDLLETVLAAAVRMSEASLLEPGCISYQFSRDITDPARLLLAEEWASQDALDTHLASTGFADFARVLGRAVAARPRFVRFDAGESRPLFG
jgi:quinol monooxygenase YgiN